MPLIDGISRLQLRAVAIGALCNKTMAGDRVFGPRDWPNETDWFPMIVVSTPRETKRQQFPGGMWFNTTIWLAVIARVVGETEEEVAEKIEVLSAEIEEALFVDPAFTTGIQSYVSVETNVVITAQGRAQIAEAGMVFELVVYQCYGPWGDPLENITGTVPIAEKKPVTISVGAPP